MTFRSLIPMLLVAGLAAAGAASASCTQMRSGPETAPASAGHVIHIAGARSCRNELLWPLLALMPASGRPVAAVARNGDLLHLGEFETKDGQTVTPPGAKSFLFFYRAGDGDTLTAACDGCRGLIGGKLVALKLKEDADWAWLDKASADDLKTLRTLEVNVPYERERLAMLERLAKINPRLDVLVMSGDGPQARVLKMFRPRMTGLTPEMLAEPTAILPALADVEILALPSMSEAKQGFSLEFLTALPKLRTLLLEEGILDKAPIPEGLKGLRSLRLSDENLKDLSAIARLTNLEELTLLTDKVRSLAPLAKFGKLRALSLPVCEKVTDFSPLKGLPLEWLELPPGISQEPFSAVVAGLPGLKGLCLPNIGKTAISVKDISAIKTLRGLDVLVFGAEALSPAQAADLEQMKGLKLLVLRPEVLKDAATADPLQKALPQTVVEPGAGLCMGSGWILAMAAGVAGTGGLATLRRRRGPGASGA
jgi:hypothetical protein